MLSRKFLPMIWVMLSGMLFKRVKIIVIMDTSGNTKMIKYLVIRLVKTPRALYLKEIINSGGKNPA